MCFDWIHLWSHHHNQDHEHFHPKVSSCPVTVFPSHPRLEAVTDLPSVILEEFAFSRIFHKCNHIMYFFPGFFCSAWFYKTHPCCKDHYLFLLLQSSALLDWCAPVCSPVGGHYSVMFCFSFPSSFLIKSIRKNSHVFHVTQLTFPLRSPRGSMVYNNWG